MLAKLKKQQKNFFTEEKIFKFLFCLVAIFLIGLLVVSNLKINQKRKELTEKIESLKTEIQSLEEKKAKLEAGISSTAEESYWEEKIREQGYIKEGETPVVIIKPEEEQTKKEESVLNLKSWLEWLKSKIQQ